MEPTTSVSSSTEQSWIRKHVNNFVLPKLAQLSEMKKTPVLNLRPASDCCVPELGLIKTALRSWTLPRLPIHKHPIPLWRMVQSVQRAQIEAPQVNCNNLFPLESAYHRLDKKPSHSNYTDLDLIHTMVKNSVKDIRKRLRPGCKVILLGRDVWLWAVMCQKMGVTYEYDPGVSRIVAGRPDVLSKIVLPMNIVPGDILFDTGFAGTIHRCVSDLLGRGQVENLMFSSGTNAFQQFKNYGLSRNRALFIEYLPKYFKSGTLRNGEFHQELASLPEFLSAAALTIRFWYHESPSWIPGASTIRKECNMRYLF